MISMKIKISTQVNGNYKNVIARFELPLFVALKPKQAEMEVMEFTGSKKGDRVHIRFIKPFKGEWVSLITDDNVNDEEAYFVDEGTTMPLGLAYWRHKHIVSKIDECHSVIIDDITYKCSNPFMSALLYPVFWIGFYKRKKVYKQFFASH
jgi:ligand-binding SRPBCC domain-containing protein